MSTIVTRSGKGTPLTNNEVDANFTNLNSDKLEKDGSNLASKVSFDITANITPATGQITWDADTGTVDIGLNGASAPVISVGEDQFYRVINQTGTTIPKGAVVMAAGTVGGSGLIKVALWNGSQPSKTIMGLALADIPTEDDPTETGFGYVLAFGKLKGIQTNGGNYSETWVNGDILYAGATGGLTKNMPAAPNAKTTMAIVVNAHATNGTLVVRVTPGSNLAEDEIVQLASLAGGDVLSYDATDGRFENKTLADAGIYASSNPAGYTTNTGTVTSVGGTGTVNGITLTGTVTSSGNLTLGGTLTGVDLTTQVTGTLPVANGGTGITSFGTGVATFLSTPSSANLAAAVTDETGTGALVFATSPTFVTPVLGTPTSGTLSSCTVDGTNAVGFLTIPQNSQSAAYTLVLADSGKHILHPSADTTARTFTIPANGSVAFPVGTAVTFINQNGAGVVTIAITTDTMRLSPGGTTGSRTLAANGSATAVKVTSTEWIISGSGLT
jgi:hypothetical protein